MYTTVADALSGTQTANEVNTYSAHIPVKAGDLIGIYEGGGICDSYVGAAATYVYASGDQDPGTTMSYLGPFTGRMFPVSVKVSLDCVVPKLTGKTLKAAKEALKDNSCTLGEVLPEGQITGTVTRQKPDAGDQLAPGPK